MEYNLHKKRKLTSVLKASIYNVHDRAEFALLTARLLKASEKPITNPLHHDIHWGCCPYNLRPVKTNVKVRVPSMQEIKNEMIFEHQRLEKIEYQRMVAQQVESEIRGRKFLERRPLPPLQDFPSFHNGGHNDAR